VITKDIAICEFAYKADSWKKARILKGILSIYDRGYTNLTGIE